MRDDRLPYCAELQLRASAIGAHQLGDLIAGWKDYIRAASVSHASLFDNRLSKRVMGAANPLPRMDRRVANADQLTQPSPSSLTLGEVGASAPITGE
jgi:hypothetical protein